MRVSKEELLHIVDLADLSLKESEIETYMGHLQGILNFADVVNGVDTEKLEETIGIAGKSNVFRKDEVKEFEDMEALLQNAKDIQNGMFKIPNVI